ncbi:MAG: DUF2341 domain-containing protein, partial [Candidatus Thermoplasmatota archaeon]
MVLSTLGKVVTMGEHTTKIGLCILAISLLLLASGGPNLLQAQQGSSPTTLDPSSGMRGGSVEIWQDEFFNASKIDQALSDHIVVNTTMGTVSMENTYPAWVDPSFLRMKPIVIANNGQETFTAYVVNLTVSYDSDMQLDFDDLRFTDQTGVQLPYYTFNIVNGVMCDAFVKVPFLPPGQTTIYMFYGNPTATTQGSFSSIFSWQDRTHPDVMVSFKSATEGAWDPDVIYGIDRFLVTWEERVGPEDIDIPLPNYERTIPSVIHGRTYDQNGQNPIPSNNTDIDVSLPGSDAYHAENPCNAFGAGKYFVVWEENPANQPLNRYESDIKGALLYPNGTVQMRFSICTATGGQFDPQVAYDSQSNRFLVVWADARLGFDDYDVRGRLYNSLGYPVGTDFPIAYDALYQGNPWLCSDNLGRFFVAYEHGDSASLGPFSLYAYRVTSEGTIIQPRITLAVGSPTVDYIFPAVSFNAKTGRYCITWNDGDVSVDPTSRESYDGNIWGKILSTNGAVMKDNFIIEAGTSFIRSVSVPYFDTMFFVAYDGTVAANQDIYGRMIAANGTVMTLRQELSDGSSQNVDWNDLAVGAGKLFVTWEDERDLVSQYADVFQYVWRSAQTVGSVNISMSFGAEEELVTQAHLMSVPIQPEQFREWRQFCFLNTLPPATGMVFDIMDQNGTIVLKANLGNGQNISDVNASMIRLRGTLTRSSAQNTPVLDKWNVSAFVGKDIYPPSTSITLTPAEPNGDNGWYVTAVTATFLVVDVDSDPINITTYYDINGFGVEIYNPDSPPVISSERPDNFIEYWSNDSVNEEVPHHRLEGIKIDTTAPVITLSQPPSIIPEGTARINGTATDYTSGSGIHQVTIYINDENVSDMVFNGESRVWFDWNFTADRGETYDIYIVVFDKAGNKMEERKTVFCPDYGVYEIGYIYWFNNPKIPVQLLVSLGLSIAVANNFLYVILPGVPSDAASVKFVATQLFLKKEYTFWDMNPSDGCSAELLVPLGTYKIKAYTYDASSNPLGEYTIITKMLI